MLAREAAGGPALSPASELKVIVAGMSRDIIGRPVHALLVPVQAERFAAVTGADLDQLVLNVTGWNKLVLLDRDRVFLFPRAADGVEWLERELTVHRALASTQLTVVPRLLRRWESLRTWPMFRRKETELVSEVSQALGTDIFDQVFADGELLSRQDAVAEVRARWPAFTRQH